MIWSGHVAHLEGKREAYTIFVEKLERKRGLEDQGVDGRGLLTHCGRVRQICVFNTVNLGTSPSSP